MRPDFSLIWGSDNAPFTPIDASDYTAGWVFRTGAPPRRVNFDYFQNLSDQRAAWLANSQLDSVRENVASGSTVNLTNAAPDTRHINITGTNTINSFTVESGRAYFVRFDAALTLTNSGSLVTQSGANITTAAGDTCIIRSTSANTVEVLGFVENPVPRASLSDGGWQRLPSGLIMQWGNATSSSAGEATWIYPISFPNNVIQYYATPNNSSPSFATIAGFPSRTSLKFSNWTTSGSRTEGSVRLLAIGY